LQTTTSVEEEISKEVIPSSFVTHSFLCFSFRTQELEKIKFLKRFPNYSATTTKIQSLFFVSSSNQAMDALCPFWVETILRRYGQSIASELCMIKDKSYFVSSSSSKAHCIFSSYIFTPQCSNFWKHVCHLSFYILNL
jgi:hypothetical protein